MSKPLSPMRETVLDLWAAGRTATAIAEETGATIETVRSIVAAARGAGDARAIHHDPGSPPTWSAERIARLKALWAEGKTCSEIAKIIGEGTTRNAVIGKVHRLQLPPRQARARPRRQRRATGVLIAARLRARARIRAVRREEAGAAALAPASAAGGVPGAVPSAREDSPVDTAVAARRLRDRSAALPRPPGCQPVRLVGRTHHQCGFILGDCAGGDTLMCGAPKDFAEPYCDFHGEIAYAAPAPTWSAERAARFYLARARRLAAEAAPVPEVAPVPQAAEAPALRPPDPPARRSPDERPDKAA